MNIIEINESLMLGKKPEVQMVNSCWVAGGAIRSWFDREKMSDIDIFFKNQEALDNFKNTNSLKTPSFSTKITDTFILNEDNNSKKIIQTIKIFRDSIESLFDSFDFTICQFAWDGTKIYSTIEAIVSVSRKHLAVHKIQEGYEIDSLRRAFKYQNKGYKPCLGTIRDLALALSKKQEVDITSQVQISPGGHVRGAIRWD